MLLQINAADFLLDLASGDVSTYKVTGEQAQKHLITCAEKFAEVGKPCWLLVCPVASVCAAARLDMLVLLVVARLSSVLAMHCCGQAVQGFACCSTDTSAPVLQNHPNGYTEGTELSEAIVGQDLWNVAHSRRHLPTGSDGECSPPGLCADCSHILCDYVT